MHDLATVNIARSVGTPLACPRQDAPALPEPGLLDVQRRLLECALRREGIDAVSYTGATAPEDRLEIEAALSENRVKVVVATSALGMGYDKPDLAFVVHFQSPGSPIAYYQQIGRAGRALDTAAVVLLRGHEDRDIQDWFIETAFPDKVDAEAVVAFLESQEEPCRALASESTHWSAAHESS